MKHRLFVFAFSLAACSWGDDGSETFPAHPLLVATTDEGHFRVEMRTAPDQPPSHGVVSVEFAIIDAASSAPQDGLTLTVVPWMTSMGHGTSVQPTVRATGGGHYVASNVSFFMPGHWELRTTIKGATTDHLAPALDVP